MGSDCHTFTDTRRHHGTAFRERLVLGEGSTRDALQRSGRWIASTSPVDVEAFR